MLVSGAAGATGSVAGQIAKVANQIVVALTIEPIGEALLFASKAGADPAHVGEREGPAGDHVRSGRPERGVELVLGRDRQDDRVVVGRDRVAAEERPPVAEKVLYYNAGFLTTRVIVAYQNQIVMEKTLEAGLARIFNGRGPAAAPPTGAAAGTQTTGPAPAPPRAGAAAGAAILGGAGYAVAGGADGEAGGAQAFAWLRFAK